MLSIAKVKSAGQAKSYYASPDQYYDKDSADFESRWGGRGAEELGLEGKVAPEDFVRLLDGNIKDGVHLGRVGNGGVVEHTPGWDLTFSAPKSLSILALVGGDKRLIDAHIQANEIAMKYIEEHYALTRQKVDGKNQYQNVDNLIYASYLHTESRAHDPQLHTHNVLMNAVMDENGQWRSLETLEIYKAKMLAGLIYRATLANLVKKIGYELETSSDESQKRDKGYFEIKGIPGELLKAFSQRRKQVLEAAQQRGLFDAVSMAKATLFSRTSKTHVDQEVLQEIWHETTDIHGVDLQGIIDQSIQNEISKNENVEVRKPDQSDTTNRQNHTNGIVDIEKEKKVDTFVYDDIHFKEHGLSKEEVESAINDVRLAYRVLAADEAVFKESDILKEAFTLSIANPTYIATPEVLSAVLDNMVDQGELLPRASSAYTTPEAFEKEKKLVLRMMEGKDSRFAIGDSVGIEAFINEFEKKESERLGTDFRFSADQRKAITEKVLNKDLTSAIQGFAGSGKTTLVRCFTEYAKSQGFVVKGFAPTGSAAETLANETGLETSTVDSFLYRRKKGELNINEIWLIDEASLVGMDNMYQVQEEAYQSKAKIINLGDFKQHESVDWGRPFHVMQSFGMHTSYIDTIVRQKNEELLQAVRDSINKDYTGAISKLKNNIYDVDDISSHYLKLSPEERDKTLVVIPDNETRLSFNDSIHKEKIHEGSLSANEISLRSLISKNLNKAQRTDWRYYEIGDVVEFQKELSGFKAGEFWRVSGYKDDALILKNEVGDESIFTPSHLNNITNSKMAVDVFAEKQLHVSDGEKVVFTKSRKDLNVKNGDEYTISKIDNESGEIHVQDDKGKSLALKTKDLHNLALTYATTSFKAQGKTSDRVMVVLESWRKNLLNHRSFYVSISRARHEALLFVDDTDKVIEKLEEYSADKTSSLDGFSVNELARSAELDGSSSNAAVPGGSPAAHLRQMFADITVAAEKLANRYGVFSHSDLIQTTLKSSLGTYDIRDIEKAIHNLRSRGELGLSHVTEKRTYSENFYTLPQNLRTEAAITRHMLQGKDRYTPVAGKSVIQRFLEARKEKIEAGYAEPIDKATQAALEGILTTRDEAVLITGSDHSGHRNVMRNAGVEIAEQRGFKVRGFSTSSEGVNQLKESMRYAGNIYHHIEKMESAIANGHVLSSLKEMWVIENASQIGADDMLRLQQVARYAGARLVIVADRQENSLSWGNVPSLLAEQGIKTIDFDRAVKSLNPQINKATEELAKGKIDEALRFIDPMMCEINDRIDPANDKKVRLNVLADTYVNLSKSDREKTAIIVPDYFSRNKVNVSIREELRKEGTLTGNELNTTLYRNANLDPFEKKGASNYKKGMVIMFESNREGISKGEYFVVSNVIDKKNELVLTSKEDGRQITFNASNIAGSRNNSVQVYYEEEKGVQVGEKIRVTKYAPNEQVKASDGKAVQSRSSGIVTRINGTTIELKLNNGRTVEIDTNKWKHLEWAYTHNLFNIKDNQYENVVVLMESGKKHFATQESLHNTLTKSGMNLRIVTDDKNKLSDTLRQNPGFRQTALNTRHVSISKGQLSEFDRQFGLGFSPGSRGLLRLESAVHKAATAAHAKIQEKAKVVAQKVQTITRQRSL